MKQDFSMLERILELKRVQLAAMKSKRTWYLSTLQKALLSERILLLENEIETKEAYFKNLKSLE